MIRQQADELVHGFVCFVEKFFVSFGEGCVAAVVFRFIPGSFENFCQGGSDGVIAFLRGVEGESCEGTIGAHLGVVHACGLWSFVWAAAELAKRRVSTSAERKTKTKFRAEIPVERPVISRGSSYFFASSERSDKSARREAGDP